uniref:Uncharacterized protein n=1 Tax=Ditylum brightwellii TaxID=49249 RepID=A0A7S4T4K9_9STRA|mmetsp:Transcript_13830/g.19346  ORF Transcript_13830/g.19346 Transcript_13830/m.19346 type:complete len:329 (+) Transcript_13830:57-1043(+)
MSDSRVAPPNRLMAPAAGSVLQLFLSTLPLLGVMIYFLYLAYKRPSLASYNIPNDADDAYIKETMELDGEQIGLMEMLYVFLSSLLIWSTLGMYLNLFVPRRREIIHRYLEEGVQVLGDVYYDNPRKKCCFSRLTQCFFADYATVIYSHPDPSRLPVSNAGDQWIVQKRVRTYQLFHRERISIVVLPELPLSGQPKADIEIDVASYRQVYATSRDRIREIQYIVAFWIFFTLDGTLYLLFQMYQVNPAYEDFQLAWIISAAFVLVVVPLVAFGGNWIRWSSYKRWLTKSGRVLTDDETNRIVIPAQSTDSELAKRPGAANNSDYSAMV